MLKVSDLFDMQYGHSLELNRLTLTTADAGIAFVSRKAGDNGISAFVKKVPGIEPNQPGELTCALSGNGVLSTFIQERPYYTGFHVACLRPIVGLTKAQLLYYCVCIKHNRYRFSYGRQANRTLRDLLVPAPEDIPAWVNATTEDVLKGENAPADFGPPLALDTSEWQPFTLSDLFTLHKGKRLTKADMTHGPIPFVAAIDGNNGVRDFIAGEAQHPSNTITVNYNGSVAEAFYQPRPFLCSDDVNVLYPRFSMTPAIGLFIATVIRQEKYRFNYGRKWHLERMRESVIRLPAKADGTPDWAWMEAYVRRLPFSSQLADEHLP